MNEYLFDVAKHVHDKYIIKNNNVYEFLKGHLDLLEILEEIPKHIYEHFGHIEIELTHEVDPEIENYEYLMIEIIVNGLSVDEALERLDSFDEWWIHEIKSNNQNVRDNIIVDVKKRKENK